MGEGVKRYYYRALNPIDRPELDAYFLDVFEEVAA
jgi:hypothetical protein